MKSINKTLIISLIASATLLAGCSTKTTTLSSGKKTIPEESTSGSAASIDEIDLAALKPISPESTKEEIFAYASALMTHKRYNDAKPILVTLTQQHPELAGPHTNLGICYFHTKQFAEATTAFKQSLSLKPNNPVVLDYLARLDKENGQFNSARDYYLKAIELDPSYAPAQRNLGILYDLYLDQPREAITHYQQYQQLIGEPDKQVTIWIRDLTNRSGIPVETSDENREEQP